jgi:hypothetical protein
VRDALINIGPLKDFAYGLRTNSDPNAAGIAKQSNYELVSCLKLLVIMKSILFFYSLLYIFIIDFREKV